MDRPEPLLKSFLAALLVVGSVGVVVEGEWIVGAMPNGISANACGTALSSFGSSRFPSRRFAHQSLSQEYRK